MDAGSLNLTLTADGSPIQNALQQIRDESRQTADIVSRFLNGAFVMNVGTTFAQAFFTGIAEDIDDVNQKLSVQQILLRNTEKGFESVSKIGILELGNLATFLKDDLFSGALAGVQDQMLADVGLGQLNALYGMASGAENAVKLLKGALGGFESAFGPIDSLVGSLPAKAAMVNGFFKQVGDRVQQSSDEIKGNLLGVGQDIEKQINKTSRISQKLVGIAGNKINSLLEKPVEATLIPPGYTGDQLKDLKISLELNIREAIESAKVNFKILTNITDATFRYLGLSPTREMKDLAGSTGASIRSAIESAKANFKILTDGADSAFRYLSSSPSRELAGLATSVEGFIKATIESARKSLDFFKNIFDSTFKDLALSPSKELKALPGYVDSSIKATIEAAKGNFKGLTNISDAAFKYLGSSPSRELGGLAAAVDSSLRAATESGRKNLEALGNSVDSAFNRFEISPELKALPASIEDVFKSTITPVKNDLQVLVRSVDSAFEYLGFSADKELKALPATVEGGMGLTIDTVKENMAALAESADSAFKFLASGADNASKIATPVLFALNSGLSFLNQGFDFIIDTLGGLQAKAASASGFFMSLGDGAGAVKNILVTIAKTIDEEILKLINRAKELHPALKIAADGAQMLGVDLKFGSQFLKEYIDTADQLEKTSTDLNHRFGQTATAISNVKDNLNSGKQAVNQFGQEASTNIVEASKKVAQATDEIGNQANHAFNDATKALHENMGKSKAAVEQGMGASKQAIAGLGEQATKHLNALSKFREGMKDLGEAGLLFSSWKRVSDTVDSVFGSFQQNFDMAKNLQNLNNQLGLVTASAGGAKEDFSYLNSEAQRLGFNFDSGSKGFVKMAAAARQTALEGQPVKEIFSAVAQAAVVMGTNAADQEGIFLALNQMISKGTVSAEELRGQLGERLPGAFQIAARAMGVTTGELDKMLESGQIAATDFLPKFAKQLGAETQGGLVSASNSAEVALNRFNNSLGSLQAEMGQIWVEKVAPPVLTALSGALDMATANEEIFSSTVDAVLIASIFRAVPALFNFAGGFDVVKEKLLSNISMLKTYAIQVVLAYAAIETFYRIMDVVKDGGKDFNTSIQSVGLSLMEIEKASGSASAALATAIPKDPVPTNWLDSAVSKFNDFNHVINKSLGIKENFGDITTNAEKQLNDMRVGVGELAEATGKAIDKAREMRQQFQGISGISQGGKGPLADIKALDAELKQLQQQKVAIPVDDKGSLKTLAEREKDLLKQRVEAGKQVQATQSAINNSISQTEQRLKAIDPTKIGSVAADELKGKLQNQLDLLNKEKVAFDALANTAVAASAKIAEKAKEQSDALAKKYANTKADLQEQLANRAITEEQFNKQSLADEKDMLEEKLALNKDYLEKQKFELNKDIRTKLIDPKAGLSADAAKKLKEEVQKLELETAETRLNLAQKVAEQKKAAEEKMLKDFQDANAKAATIIQKVETDKIAAIKQRQLNNEITEEEAAQKIEAIKANSITKEIELINSEISEIKKLKENGALTAKEADKKELEASQKLSQAKLKYIEQELQQREQAKRKQLQDIEAANKQAEAAIQQSSNAQIIAIKKRQLAGQLTEEAAAKEIEKINLESSGKKIEQVNKEIAQVKEMRAKGLLTEREATDKQIALQNELGQANLQRIDQQLQAQKKIQEDFKRSQEEAKRLIEQSTNAQILAVKKRQLAGQLSEEQAAKEIDRINLESSQRRIEQINQEIAQIDQMRSKNLLNEQEANDKKIALQSELNQISLQQVDLQLQAEKRLQDESIKGIEERTKAAITGLQSQVQASDELINSMKGEQDLLNAQLNLQSAIANLDQERLQIKAQEATSDADKKQFEMDLLKIKESNRQKAAEGASELLKITQAQKDIELEREAVMGRIAELEAQAALEKAKANKASQAELDSLSQVLSLRKQIVAQSEAAQERQKQINQMEREALTINQRREQERAQAEIKAKQSEPISSSTAGEGSGGGGSSGGGKAVNLSLYGEDITKNRDATDLFKQAVNNVGNQKLNLLQAGLANGGNNKFFDMQLNAGGFGNIVELMDKIKSVNDAGFMIKAQSAATQAQMSGKDPIEAITNLVNEVKNLAAKPSQLTVNSNNPVKDAAAIYGSLSKRSVSNANL
jgi:tape measure domain-containing protein